MNNKLRRIRIFRGLSQSQLAALTGLTKGYISQIEKGREPRYIVKLKLAKALGVEIREIFLPKNVASSMKGEQENEI